MQKLKKQVALAMATALTTLSTLPSSQPAIQNGHMYHHPNPGYYYAQPPAQQGYGPYVHRNHPNYYPPKGYRRAYQRYQNMAPHTTGTMQATPATTMHSAVPAQIVATGSGSVQKPANSKFQLTPQVKAKLQALHNQLKNQWKTPGIVESVQTTTSALPTNQQPQVTVPENNSTMPTDAIIPDQNGQMISPLPQPEPLMMPAQAQETPEIIVYYDPNDDQLNQMLDTIFFALPKGTNRDESSINLMKLYIAGSHKNQTGDFAGKLVYNSGNGDYDAELIFPEGYMNIEMWGQSMIPGMLALIKRAQTNQNQELVTRLQGMLEADGYQVPNA